MAAPSTNTADTGRPRFQFLRILGAGLFALAMLAALLYVLAMLFFGPAASRLLLAASSFEGWLVPMALFRAGALLALLWFWPALHRWLAQRHGWPEPYAAAVRQQGRPMIVLILIADVILFNAPLWAALFHL